MLSNERINDIIEKCKKNGYTVRVRDVAYAILCHTIDDKAVIYKCLFAEYGSVGEYDGSRATTKVKELVTKALGKTHEDISFEENKAYMLKLKKDTELAMENHEIDKKDGLKILADLSVKLNDKFSVSEEVKDQIVIVQTKFNSVCSCGRELYIPTKEDLMKQYNLKEA